MLETVTKGFRAARNRLAGKQEITPELVDESLRDIRVALLEADVAFDVVKSFVARVREKAVGATVQTTITDKKGRKHRISAGEHFIKVCHDELEALMGPVDTSLKFKPKGGVTTMMLVGLQGSGKTTTVAKLASYLEKKGRKPLLVAADIYRPAAVDQLQVLGERLGVPVFFQPDTLPPDLAVKGVEAARAQKCDVVLIDTAGRLAIDEQLMNELNLIKASVQPDDILLVCDAMIGQDAVRTAAEFDRRLALDGFILTKLDGDARGGAALSVRHITGAPIKFVGVAEKVDGLEVFHPDRMASRILGMGDVLSLIEDAHRTVDIEQAQKLAKKVKSGKGFDLADFKAQIGQMRKMGGLAGMIDKLPAELARAAQSTSVDERRIGRLEGIINSMTPQERAKPELLKASRKRRIAAGAGVSVQEVNQLLNQFEQTQKMMKMVAKGGMQKLMRGMKGMLPGMR